MPLRACSQFDPCLGSNYALSLDMMPGMMFQIHTKTCEERSYIVRIKFRQFLHAPYQF